MPFSSSKLRSGYGSACLYVLEKLTESAMAKANIEFLK